MKKLIGLAFTVLILTTLNALAEEKTAADAQSTTLTEKAEAAASPTTFLTYNYYHYQMTGQSAAKTNIYKFGESTVDLHMLIGTWLYSKDWTFVTIVPHISNRVETIYEPTALGINYKTIDTTSGLSDIRLMAVTPLSLNPAHMTMLDLGVSLPTGSIDKYFTSAPNQRAAYNMQMGSGTTDLVVGTTVTNTMDKLVSSGRGQATVRGGRNSNGYALGNEYLAKLSSIYNVSSIFSSGVVANYKTRTAVIGKDEKYELFNDYKNPSSGISGDGHQYYHSEQTTWDATVMAKIQSAAFKNMNASLEVGIPFAQGASNKDDIKLNIDYYAAAALNASF